MEKTCCIRIVGLQMRNQEAAHYSRTSYPPFHISFQTSCGGCGPFRCIPRELLHQDTGYRGQPHRGHRCSPPICLLLPYYPILPNPIYHVNRQGSIPLWVLPSAYNIFYFLPHGCTPWVPPHTGVKVELQPEPK